MRQTEHIRGEADGDVRLRVLTDEELTGIWLAGLITGVIGTLASMAFWHGVRRALREGRP
jgi:hypothetical protein